MFFKKLNLNNLEFKYDKNLIIYNYGEIIKLSNDLIETDKLKIIGKNFILSYLDNLEMKVLGEINQICIK